MILSVNRDYFLKNINRLIFVMVKFGVLFEARTEFLNIIKRASASNVNIHFDTKGNFNSIFDKILTP
jgi:hypothetical protein